MSRDWPGTRASSALDLEPSNIVVVGSINRDYVIETPRRPGPGETVCGAHLSIASGGKGANQASAAALLGAPVTLIGRIGDDPVGQELLAALQVAGLETSAVIATPAAATGAAFVSVTPDGENSIIVASGANWLLDANDLRDQHHLLESAGVLLLQLEVPDDAIEAAVVLAGSETTVVLNAAPYRTLSPAVLERVDILVVNAIEARQLVGEDVCIEEPAAFEDLGPRTTIVTLGTAGARAFIDGDVVTVSAPHAEVVDTTGAGDAFVGALSAWLLSERVSRADPFPAPLGRAMAAASVAAAHSVGRLGAQSSYGTRADLGAPWR